MEAKEDAEGGFTASDRYFCPFPGCKRSFAELWRLKVHYRAPPDVRGSGKERGHGTELTHCPKCGKGLKPGKHHVGCSGGKTAPRQAKRSRVATPTGLIPPDGMNGDMQGMYGAGMMMQGSYGPGMQGAPMHNGYSQPYGQQYPAYAQQYQPDGSYYQGQPQHMGGVMQPQMQQQQPGSMQSPTLGMGMMQDGNASSGAAMLVHAGSGEMLAPNSQSYMYQQPQQQQQQVLMQPMMQMPQHQQPQQLLQQPQPQELLQQHMQPSMDVMGTQQQPPQQPQQLLMPQQQMAQVKQEAVAVAAQTGAMTASGTFLAEQQLQQQQQQSQQQQQQQAMLGQGHEQGYLPHDAAAATAGLMPPPAPVPMAQQQQVQMQQPSSGMMPPPPPPVQHQISSTLFDEIDNMAAGGAVGNVSENAELGPGRAPSPPPLPADFPSAVGAGTLFNFAQFNQKLPAAGGPSQQMAMMPRGMEQELPPSMDDLWTPEATYDHHSDGDLMQLLFGAPEQPPTMATIHLHHFLEDDACSSPLLTGLLGSSMDDLRAAEAKATTNPLQTTDNAVVAAAAAAGAGGTAGAKVQQQHPQQQHPQQQQQGVHDGSLMLPPAAVAMPGPHQLVTPQPQPHQVQHPHQLQPCQLLQQQHCSAPLNGTNGMITGQCGAAAAVQVQMHMQVQVQMHHGEAAAGVVQIKGEEGNCLLQKAAAVTSLTEAVASRAT